MRKRGEILIENVIFIILNLLFLAILILFLWKQGSGAVLLEQAHAKQIALVVDSAKPHMEVVLNMEKARSVAEENEVPFDEVVRIVDNQVVVRLSEGGGYEYSFFNDVKAFAYAERVEGSTKFTGNYVITITEND